VPRLAAFLRALRDACRREVAAAAAGGGGRSDAAAPSPPPRVLLYDSVGADGNVSYANELTAANEHWLLA